MDDPITREQVRQAFEPRLAPKDFDCVHFAQDDNDWRVSGQRQPFIFCLA